MKKNEIPKKVLKMLAKLPQPSPPKQTQTPQLGAIPKAGGYVCSVCGAKFNTLNELGTHRNQEQAEFRKHLTQRPQLSRVPPVKPKNTAIVKVEHIKGASRIYLTRVIPKGWNVVRMASIPEGENAIWIYMEVLDKNENKKV
ncbi:MAG: C2H2-type zinc finger protein [Candidatus Bathyarchaeota archaeon]|nr:C2H2-type zinc finger protein [Candidatus Bathyarchaeota archaeon]